MPRLDPIAAFTASSQQRATLAERNHRPWPLPGGPWVMGQSWLDLLFAHWPVEPARLARVVPAQLPLDTIDGRAWIGVTPFRVEGVHLRYTPPPPVVSRFCELNVRTYVTVGGKPGIYFFSLDAASRLAVAAARRAYRLPYFRARMSCERAPEGIRYRSERASGDGPPAAFDAVYRPTGKVFNADPGSLDYFLTERYCLYTLDADQTVHRADIHHPPWPLQTAEGEFELNTMTRPQGIELEGDPLLHFSARQDVVIWPIGPVEG